MSRPRHASRSARSIESPSRPSSSDSTSPVERCVFPCTTMRPTRKRRGERRHSPPGRHDDGECADGRRHTSHRGPVALRGASASAPGAWRPRLNLRSSGAVTAIVLTGMRRPRVRAAPAGCVRRTVPMDPAPRVTTRSPSRAIRATCGATASSDGAMCTGARVFANTASATASIVTPWIGSSPAA